MANLEIGGLFTPAGIRAAAGQLESAVKTISKEVFNADSDPPPAFENAWDQFSQEFVAWKSDNLGFLSSVLNSTRDELSGFVERFEALRAQWVSINRGTNAATFSVTADTVGGALESAGSAVGKTLASVSVGLLALGVVLILLWVAYKRSK